MQTNRQMKIPNRLPLIIITAIMSLATAAAQQHGKFPKHEVRAVWLTTLSGLDWPRTSATGASSIRQQQQELCGILDKLQAAGINTVLFQARIRATTVYPSAIIVTGISSKAASKVNTVFFMSSSILMCKRYARGLRKVRAYRFTKVGK